MTKFRVLLPFGFLMLDEKDSPVTSELVDGKPAIAVKLTRKKRARPAADAVDIAPSKSDNGQSDGVIIQRIRDGDWREVLLEVGSAKYNELRLLALK